MKSFGIAVAARHPIFFCRCCIASIPRSLIPYWQIIGDAYEKSTLFVNLAQDVGLGILTTQVRVQVSSGPHENNFHIYKFIDYMSVIIIDSILKRSQFWSTELS